MKNGKQWAKGNPRGEMSWKREGSCLTVQWIEVPNNVTHY